MNQPKTLGNRISESLDRHFYWWLCSVFVLAALVKSLRFFPGGRVWAEEGRDFFPVICTQTFPEALGALVQQNLQLATNLGIYLASRVGVEAMAWVTTGYSAALAGLTFLLIGIKRRELGLSGPSVLIVVLVAMGMPQASEVWANTINLHFYALLVAGVVLIVPARGKNWIAASLALLLVCGLSGIPANFAAPVFLFAAWREKSAVRAAQGLTLCTTSLIEIGLLAASGYSDQRNAAFEPVVTLLATITQSFWSLFGSKELGKFSAETLLPLAEGGPTLSIVLALGFVLISAALIALVFSGPLSWKPGNEAGWRRAKIILLIVWSQTLMISLALGDRQGLISALAGGRYFFATNVFLAILFLGGFRFERLAQKIAIVMLVISSLIGLKYKWKGPEWLSETRPIQSENGPQLEIQIWPKGWTMAIPGECLNDNTLGRNN